MIDYLRGKSKEEFDKILKECIGKVEGKNDKDWQDIVDENNLGIHRDVLRKAFQAPMGGYATYSFLKNKDQEEFDKIVMFINDIHLPFERDDVLDLIKKHSEEITHLVICGDLMDCESISSYPSIERIGLTNELIYTHNFLKKVREILDKNQEIIMIKGNHCARMHKTISKMSDKELKPFLNPEILEMFVDGFTIYKNGEKQNYEGIEGLTYIPHWYALIDDIVVCHPLDFSRVKGKMLENVTSYFINQGLEFSTIVFGHTHKASQGVIDRFENKFAVENPCLCKPQGYADCGKLGYTPQTYGYTIIKYNNGERVNPNNIKTYYLEENVDKKENYKIKLK